MKQSKLTDQESLEAKKHNRDKGLIVGAKITAWFRRTFHIPKRQKKIRAEREPLLANQKSANDGDPAHEISTLIQKPEEAPALRDVLSYQTTLNLVVYTFLAFYTLAYDQV